MSSLISTALPTPGATDWILGKDQDGDPWKAEIVNGTIRLTLGLWPEEDASIYHEFSELEIGELIEALDSLREVLGCTDDQG